MPELPEVETLRLGLQKYLVGRKIKDIEVRIAKIFVGKKEDVIGAKIIGLKRIGKGLIIELDNDFVLAVHLKMTGQLIYRGREVSKVPNVSKGKIGGELPGKWTRVIFKLKTPTFAKASAGRQKSKLQNEPKDAYLYYNDLRRFGWIKIVKSERLKDISFFKDLGPEPFKDLTFELFRNIIKKSNVAIKSLLMDQKKISGIGNIYANDACFEAGINPQRKAKSLSETEVKKLYGAILKVLRKGLDYGGSSDENFVNVLGQEGNYQNHTLVYGKEGQKCSVCGSEIQKIKLGGRGTYFCEKCQK